MLPPPLSKTEEHLESMNILGCLLFDVLATVQRVLIRDNGRRLMSYEQSQKRAGMRIVNVLSNFHGQR